MQHGRHLSWQNVRHFLGLLIKILFSFSKLFKTKSTFLYEKYPLLCLFVDLCFLNKTLHKVCSKRLSTLIGLTFAGINFRGLLQPRNSKDFAGIYFRGWDFFKNFAIFADQILVMFFFFFFLQNGKMKG